MELLDGDVAPFVHGVLDVYRDENSVRLKRFTDV